MPFRGEDEIERWRPKVRFRVVHQAGFASPDVDHLLRETLMRPLVVISRQTRIPIDLSTVWRIDSAGLGALMNCYCDAPRNSDALKVLDPTSFARNECELL